MKKILRTLLWLFRPPRKISFSREGWIFTLFTFPVGLAAINTGNNMLYLVLGMLLSLITLNGILSESTVKKVEVVPKIPGSGSAGDALQFFAEIINHKRYFPSYLLRVRPRWVETSPEVKESSCLKLVAGEHLKLRLRTEMPQRGIFHLKGFTLSTRFPFGLFDKSREVAHDAEVIIYPKALSVPVEALFGAAAQGERERPWKGMGDELYGLREYHPGDDARRIHWKISARVGYPVLREYSSAGRETTQIIFDTSLASQSAEDLQRFEAAVSQVTFLVERAFAEGLEVGLFTAQAQFPPDDAASADAQFHRIMQFLASVQPEPKAHARGAEIQVPRQTSGALIQVSAARGVEVLS